MGAIFLDDTLCNRLEGRPSPQLANGVHEVGVQGQRQAAAAPETVSFFHGQAVDLPSTKLPGSTIKQTDVCSLGFKGCLQGDSRLLFNKLC